MGSFAASGREGGVAEVIGEDRGGPGGGEWYRGSAASVVRVSESSTKTVA